jgi:hypothetical protein
MDALTTGLRDTGLRPGLPYGSMLPDIRASMVYNLVIADFSHLNVERFGIAI